MKELSSRARRVLKNGYIAYSLVRPYLNNFVLIEDKIENFIGSTGFAVYKPLKGEIKFYFYFMLTNYIKDLYLSYLKGFNSPSITKEQFENTLFSLPPLAEQKRIVQKLEDMLSKIKQAKELITEAKETFELRRASILHKAFTGELTAKWREVNEIESVEKLLEKINEEKIKKWEEECVKAEVDGKRKPKKPEIKDVKEMKIEKVK